MGSVDCLGRIPYASVIGFIMVFVGGGIMAGTLYEAVQRTDKFFKDNFFPFNEFLYVWVAGLGAAGSVVLIAFIILIFAFLATSATQGKIYRGDQCILGGRCSAGFFMFVSYIASVTWLAVSVVLVVPVLCWLIFTKICTEELAVYRNTGRFNYVFNITTYGIYAKPYLSDRRLQYNETIKTANGFINFCSQVSTVGPLYACALGGAVFVILGWLFYIASLSTYYMKLKLTKEITEFKKSLDLQNDYELDHLPPTAPYEAW